LKTRKIREAEEAARRSQMTKVCLASSLHYYFIIFVIIIIIVIVGVETENSECYVLCFHNNSIKDTRMRESLQ